MIRRFNVIVETEDMDLEPEDVKRIITFHCSLRNLKALYCTEDSYQKILNIAEKIKREKEEEAWKYV